MNIRSWGWAVTAAADISTSAGQFIVPEMCFLFPGHIRENDPTEVTDMTDEKTIRRLSQVGIFGNILLTAFKLYAGIFGNSAAMVSDAIHSLSDVFATAVAGIGAKISRKAADSGHPYGHDRFESFAGLILGVILAATGLEIGKSGLIKIIDGSSTGYTVPGVLPLIAAIVSIITKELMYRYTMKYAKKMGSAAFEADAWHHRSDALSSVGSLLGIAAARMGFPVMDPVISLLICVFILKVAWDIGSEAVRGLLDTSCGALIENEIRNFIAERKKIESLDLLHTRRFGNKAYADIEISVDKNLSLLEAHGIAEELHNDLEKNFPQIKHVMIHVNPGK